MSLENDITRIQKIMEEDSGDPFKAASEEELEQRPGWREERERERREEERRQAEIAANRQKTERLSRIATMVGFTPEPPDEDSLRYQPNIKASREDGGHLKLTLGSRWRYGPERNQRLHVEVNQYEPDEGGRRRSALEWGNRPVKVVLDYNRTDEQLAVAIKRRIDALDKAIVASQEYRTTESGFKAKRDQFMSTGQRILGKKAKSEYGDTLNYKNGKIVVDVDHEGNVARINLNQISITDFPALLQTIQQAIG